jgi:hypothetical protein
VLRLLNRREYVNTVNDLLGPPISGPATSCPVTFSYDPTTPGGGTFDNVVVAGTFNNWSPTIANGGWPMVQNVTTKIWSLTTSMAPGSYEYKFVQNEQSWINDPSPTATRATDGNNTLTVTCPPVTADPTAGFPPDARPTNFLFDTNGPLRTPDGTQVELYHDAAAGLVGRITNVGTFVGCDFSGSNASSCASTWATNFGLKAFRRPLTTTEVSRFAGLVTGQSDFATGVKVAVRAFLESPNFLYRTELGTQQSDGTYKLTQYEIASALSYQFWATMPDAALFDAAATNQLSTTAQIEAQARRLLGDTRAREVVGVFAEQWTGAEKVTSMDKPAYPAFTADVRSGMREEAKRFAEYVILDSPSPTYAEMLGAGYSQLNGTLASYYGVTGVTGAGYVKASFPADGQHAGILSLGAVMTATAHADQTSPVFRGLYVRRNLLCQVFGTPPPNAGGTPADDPGVTTTTRERFDAHMANPSCASCHQFIDSVGNGFERFDPVGLIRTMDNGQKVDSSGDMNDVEALNTGTHATFDTTASLASTLVSSAAANRCFVRQYFRYARGLLDDPANDGSSCTVDNLVSAFRSKNYSIPELMVALTKSPEFVLRK